MMLKPKNLTTLSQQQRAVAAVMALCIMVLFFRTASTLRPQTVDLDVGGGTATSKAAEPEVPAVVRLHAPETFVPASAYSGAIKKPLEAIANNGVSCPERGGKNTQCGKVSAEYRFNVPSAGDYYLYFQVLAPGLNDNSLWVGLVSGADQSAFDACETPSGGSGPLIPHKHLTSSKKFLCCPAYLGKNKKKGLAGFYSDCCYAGLGKTGSETGCVLDLEVDESPRWNELPRVVRTTDDDSVVVIRVYAREDGTSWLGVVLSTDPSLDERSISKLKRSQA